MCSVLLSYLSHPSWAWQIAANRDEWLHRESLAPQIWPTVPRIVGGRDLVAGGTWFAVQPNNALFAALTSQHHSDNRDQTGLQSRGLLIPKILSFGTAKEAALSLPQWYADRAFNPSCLLFGDSEDLCYAEGQGTTISVRALPPGHYVLCNQSLDIPPNHKMLRLKSYLTEVTEAGANLWSTLMQDVLRRTEQTSEIEMSRHQRAISALNVRTEHYGTRSSLIATCTVDRRFEYLATEGNPSDSPFVDFSDLLR